MREALFTDLYSIPEWRRCMVQSCRFDGIVRSPQWFCERHAVMLWDERQQLIWRLNCQRDD